MVNPEFYERLAKIFCGDEEELYEYKSGPQLVHFFNTYFQYQDVYGQGFNTRWRYVNEKLIEFLRKNKIDVFLSIILSKNYLLTERKTSEVDALEHQQRVRKKLDEVCSVYSLKLSKKDNKFHLVEIDLDLEEIGKDHTHNHILINAIDSNSDKKLIWNYSLERNLRMISDRISKMAGAKIIEKRYSYRDYQKYRQSSHKFELKQRLYFLMQQSKSFDDFLEKAVQLHVHIDFSQKHSRFMMTDRAMTKPIRGRQLSKRDLCDEEFFRTHFAKIEIESRLEFLLNRVNSLEELLTKAKELNLTIDLKQKNVIFILEDNGNQSSLSHKKISDKKLYDVNFFQDYFKNKKVGISEGLENLQDQYHAFQEERDKEKVAAEEIEEAFEEFKEKRDAVHEFEVELAEHQIEKLVDAGIYIKVAFGIKQSGLIFIPNYQLDILEEENQTKYKVYIRETTSYFVYNKEYSDKNQYIKGRTLIRQLTNDSRAIPYRRPTVERLQEKISEINLLIELTETDKKYQDVKDELVAEIAELDIKLTQTNEKIATLNKMAEVLINLKSEDPNSRKLARYDFSKLNLTESITLEQVTEDIKVLQEELGHYLDEYEGLARKLETFVKLLNTGRGFNVNHYIIQNLIE